MKDLPFAELWEATSERSPEEERLYWDRRAGDFAALSTQPCAGEGKDVFSFLEERGALFPGARVLDIGCGAGRHALEFARRGALVTGLDISPRMIAHAEEKAAQEGLAARFLTLSWQEADLEALGFARAFDLVLSVRSPAINSEAALLRMQEASCGSCFLSSFIFREDLLLAPFTDARLPGLAAHRHEGAALYAFNLLCRHGFYPDFVCGDTQWRRDEDIEEKYAEYLQQLRPFFPAGQSFAEELREFLYAQGQNGLVSRAVRGKTAWIFW
ncbi:MAG: class I SAM-dependent methyltransferase [Desulfovibrio sp.]|jgi:SAM-dependent methyltransferase|nr:class I SAM-dependent methyltransferase [Desulfovibrio sp.]